MLWSKEKEKRMIELYKRLKGSPMEKYLSRISISLNLLYDRNGCHFWSALKMDEIRDTRINQRRARIRRYVRGLVDTFENNVYLLTLTFSDESLALLSDKTRLRYVRAYLQSNTLDYFACIDFGSKTGREHYHVICALSDESLGVAFNPKNNKQYLSLVPAWEYGFHSLKKISVSRKDVVKTCAYAFKASNYAFKNADSDHRPFHKRGVEHIKCVRDDFDLALFERALESHSPNRTLTPSGFEGENAKKFYVSPSVVLVYSMNNLTSYGAFGGDDTQFRFVLN